MNVPKVEHRNLQIGFYFQTRQQHSRFRPTSAQLGKPLSGPGDTLHLHVARLVGVRTAKPIKKHIASTSDREKNWSAGSPLWEQACERALIFLVPITPLLREWRSQRRSLAFQDACSPRTLRISAKISCFSNLEVDHVIAVGWRTDGGDLEL